MTYCAVVFQLFFSFSQGALTGQSSVHKSAAMVEGWGMYPLIPREPKSGESSTVSCILALPAVSTLRAGPRLCHGLALEQGPCGILRGSSWLCKDPKRLGKVPLSPSLYWRCCHHPVMGFLGPECPSPAWHLFAVGVCCAAGRQCLAAPYLGPGTGRKPGR